MADESMKTIKCTLWGNEATSFNPEDVGKVVALKDASVGDFGGKNVSLGRNGEITYNFAADDRAKKVRFSKNNMKSHYFFH